MNKWRYWESDAYSEGMEAPHLHPIPQYGQKYKPQPETCYLSLK
jgi:hypothetical protein